MEKENRLGSEKIPKLVLKIAIPAMLAQFVSVLYSIIDRIFVGNIPEIGDKALAGIGVCAPIVTLISAFAFLIGVGGAPLLGIALGEKKKDKAKEILANCFLALIVVSVLVTVLALALKNPMLRLFGAKSDEIFYYADKYFTIYVSGTIFALMSIGMAQFVVSQGYAKIGMASVILGAVTNMILDPVFIFGLDMGVNGAALATIIGQALSASFVLIFLFFKANVKITFGNYHFKTILNVLKLGITPFTIIALDNVMLIAMNALLQKYGMQDGDLLIKVNTIAQSFMLVLTMPLGGISAGTQCILSYNYGAGNSKRVLEAQKYITLLCVLYCLILFLLARFMGQYFVRLFTSDGIIAKEALRAIKICSLMVLPLGVQYAIVDGFTGMGQVKFSMILSSWRKLCYFGAIFIIPLFCKADKIFYAEPISDVLCLFVTLPIYLIMIKKILKNREEMINLNKPDAINNENIL